MVFDSAKAVRAARQHLDQHLEAIETLQQKIVSLSDPANKVGIARLNASFADLKVKHTEFADDCCVVVGSIEDIPKRPR